MPGGPSSYAACEGMLKPAGQRLAEAMSVDTYESILIMKGISLESSPDELMPDEPLIPFEARLFPDAGRSYTVPEKLLREDLSSNKVCWYGDFSKDFWQYTKNSNPLFALWCSHPLHPISRRERHVITIAQIMFVMMISTSIPRAERCYRGGFDSCAVEHAVIYDWKDKVYANHDFCCLTQRMGVQWFLEAFGLEWGGGLYALAANIIFGQLLFQAGANCCCFQCGSKRVRITMESIGHLLILTFCALCCIPLPKFVQYCIAHDQVMFVFHTFVTGKLGSMILTSIFQSFVWYICWRMQCPKEVHGSRLCGVDFAPGKADDKDCHQCGFHVTALDYRAFVQDCRYLGSGDKCAREVGGQLQA